MVGAELRKPEDLNTFFFNPNPISDDLATKIFTDQYYGLNNLTNYGKWDALANLDTGVRRTFKNELRSYFGLSFVQVNQFEDKWNSYFKQQSALVYNLLPSPNYRNDQGAAYW